jgi:benzoyl-CoA reductase/2-hydroxyglutaryl-CoA dehydratase subunit BcrC/BadD/HgdB
MSQGGEHVDRRIQSYLKMRELMAIYYMTAKNARTNNQMVAWITSGAPVEFLHAMDVIPIYPENHAAMCATQKMAVELEQAAEAKGYSMDLCSYARTDFGQIYTGKSPIMGLPEPDFLFACNNICSTVIKWYEVVSRIYKVPLFVMDMPFLHEGPQAHILEYVVVQMKEFIGFLEERTGKRFDPERFLDVLQKTVEATRLWGEILGTCTHVPAPMTCFDAFMHMAPIVTLRGTQECIDYYVLLRDELLRRIEQGIWAVPGERHRLLWDNLPIWFNVKGLSEWLAARNTSLVAATYTSSWTAIIYAPEELEKLDDVLHEMARAYLTPYINNNFASRVETLKGMLSTYRADGFLMHSDRSCKPYSLGQYVIRDIVMRETGIPGLVLEADHNDPRYYAEGPIYNRLEAFLESLG